MRTNPRDIVNPMLIDTVVSNSATVMTDDEKLPGRIVLKVQYMRPPQVNPDTMLIALERSDAHILNQALTRCLKDTSN